MCQSHLRNGYTPASRLIIIGPWNLHIKRKIDSVITVTTDYGLITPNDCMAFMETRSEFLLLFTRIAWLSKRFSSDNG